MEINDISTSSGLLSFDLFHTGVEKWEASTRDSDNCKGSRWYMTDVFYKHSTRVGGPCHSQIPCAFGKIDFESYIEWGYVN